MISSRFQDIVIGPRQVFLFDLEDETAKDQQRVETCLSDHVRTNGPVDLEAFVPSAAAALGMSDFQVMQCLFWLAHDLKIHFRAAGEKIPPNAAKKRLTESSPERLQVAFNQQVDAAVFQTAKEIFRELTQEDFGLDRPDQVQFARHLIRLIRDWKSALETFLKQARQPGFPGSEEIEAGLGLIRTLAANLDAASLIHALVQNAGKVAHLVETMNILTDFYENQAYRWRRLLRFERIAGQTLSEMISAPEVKEAHGRFRQILSSPLPYDAVEEAWRLFQSLEIQFKGMVACQTRQRRLTALEEIETLIKEMKQQLDLHAAGADVRNQALYTLRSKAKSIQMAEDMAEIGRLAQAARESFELWLAALENA